MVGKGGVRSMRIGMGIVTTRGRGSAGRTGFGVALEAEHDLRGAVPPRCDVFGHVACVFLWIDGEAAGEAEVADLEFAVGIDEQVARLQISVQDVRGVDVLQAAQDLVDEGLKMGIRQGLTGAYNGGQVAFHEFCDAWCR